MTDWNELIDDVEYYHCEAVNVQTKNMDKAANNARAALLSAIQVVERERDEAVSRLPMLKDPNSGEAKEAIMLYTRRYWTGEEQIRIGLWMAGDKYQEMEAKLAAAEAELAHYRGFVPSHPWMEYRARTGKE